jgi:hypothetical protein
VAPLDTARMAIEQEAMNLHHSVDPPAASAWRLRIA